MATTLTTGLLYTCLLGLLYIGRRGWLLFILSQGNAKARIEDERNKALTLLLYMAGNMGDARRRPARGGSKQRQIWKTTGRITRKRLSPPHQTSMPTDGNYVYLR